MNTVYIHINETLDAQRLGDIRNELLHVPHVCHVELSSRMPHDMLVEFEPHHNVPMTVLNRLARHGLHSDIMSC